VSLTGVGEDIVSNGSGSKNCNSCYRRIFNRKSIRKNLSEFKPYDGFAGAIGIDKQGNIFHQDSHPSMVFASFDGENEEVFE
jgi:L-asparaginase